MAESAATELAAAGAGLVGARGREAGLDAVDRRVDGAALAGQHVVGGAVVVQLQPGDDAAHLRSRPGSGPQRAGRRRVAGRVGVGRRSAARSSPPRAPGSTGRRGRRAAAPSAGRFGPAGGEQRGWQRPAPSPRPFSTCQLLGRLHLNLRYSTTQGLGQPTIQDTSARCRPNPEITQARAGTRSPWRGVPRAPWRRTPRCPWTWRPPRRRRRGGRRTGRSSGRADGRASARRPRSR